MAERFTLISAPLVFPSNANPDEIFASELDLITLGFTREGCNPVLELDSDERLPGTPVTTNSDATLASVNVHHTNCKGPGEVVRKIEHEVWSDGTRRESE